MIKVPIYPDETPEGADWIRKNSWDYPPGIDSAEKFRAYLGDAAAVAHFKTLPIYKWHIESNDPPWLKDL